MRYKSYAKSLEGTVKEVLGTAFSVGCQVDGKSPKAVSDAIEAGEIDSKSKTATRTGTPPPPNGAGRVPRFLGRGTFPPCAERDDADSIFLQFLKSKKNFDLMRQGGLGFSGMSNGVQGLLFKLGVAIRKALWQ